MSDNILSLEGVRTNIAQYHILQGVDLNVPRGAVTMLLGRNGVGKTTTLRTIIGHWRAHEGRILFNGEAIWIEGIWDKWFEPETRAYIARMHKVLRDNRQCFAGLLPEPLVPISPKVSPSWTWKSTSLRAQISSREP